VKRYFPAVLTAVCFFCGCATQKPPDYTMYRAHFPKSVLVVPVINNSAEVNAEDYFLATVTQPLAERGYYVFPVNLSRNLLYESGLSDPGLVHNAAPQKMGELFGTDAVLYITIEKWNTKYVLLTAQTTVSFTYTMKDTRSGETIWQNAHTMVYTPHSQSSGSPIADLVVMVVNAAATKAAPPYMPLARQANVQAFCVAGTGIPCGHYNPDYGKDSGKFVGLREHK